MSEPKDAAGLLDEMRAAMKNDQVRVELVRTFGHGDALRIEHKGYGGRWKVIKTLLFPPTDGSTADTFSMLMEMRGDGGPDA